MEADDLKILFIHRFGWENTPMTKQEIADSIGVSPGSVNFRLGNFKAIDGVGRADHIASLSYQVHQKYSGLSLQELKNLAFGNTGENT